MKKLIVMVMAVFSLNLAIKPANAISIDIAVATVGGVEEYFTTGSFTDNGDFGIASEIPGNFQFFTTSSFDAIEYFDDMSGSALHFSGAVNNGSEELYDYEFTLSVGQVAWGTLWDWNSTTIPLLIIFDCGAGGLGDACHGDILPMQTLPFPGAQTWTFDGAVSATTVPVPAAVWLFGSGLLGLVGMARRNKV